MESLFVRPSATVGVKPVRHSRGSHLLDQQRPRRFLHLGAGAVARDGASATNSSLPVRLSLLPYPSLPSLYRGSILGSNSNPRWAALDLFLPVTPNWMVLVVMRSFVPYVSILMTDLLIVLHVLYLILEFVDHLLRYLVVEPICFRNLATIK